MTFGDRIKKIRKERELTQAELGKLIGIKPNSISLIESGNRNASEQVILAICRSLNVNEEWLRTGIGEMTVKPDTFSLDEFARERGMTELELGIIKVYFNLPPPVRGEMLADLKKLLNSVDQTAAPELAETLPPSAASRITAVPARLMPDPDRAALEQEADEFAAMARAQFIQEKKRESGVLSASTSGAE